MPWRQPELLQGPGSVKRLPSLIKSKGFAKVLIVTDGMLPKLGLLNSLYEACAAEGV